MIAHRGVSRLAPENTLPAYELGGKYGYYGFECDVHETLDQEFVLMHDETIDRMTNGTGKVSDYTLDELLQCIVQNGAHYQSFPYLRVPVLKDFLRVCKGCLVTPVIEIKRITNASLKRLLALINQWFEFDEVIIISFHKETLVEVRQLNPSVHVQWITKITEKNIQFCSAHLMGINTKHSYITEDLVLKAHEEHVLVNVWTVNDGVLLRKLLQMGVDFITTDCLMNHQVVNSQHSVAYSFQSRETYKEIVNDKFYETLKLNLEIGNWRWDSLIKGIEIRSKLQIPVLLSIKLPKVKDGDVINFSFWCYHLNQQALQVQLKCQQHQVIEIETGLSPGWEFIEFQGILTKIQEDEDYVIEISMNKETYAHCLLKHLNIKIDFV